MGLVAVGIALVVLGIVLTFSNLLGFAVGVPLVAVGVGIAALGLVLWIVGAVFRAARPRGVRP